MNFKVAGRTVDPAILRVWIRFDTKTGWEQ